MTTDVGSFTIAWVPHAGSKLSRFGAAWTGWCPEAGEKRRRMRLLRQGIDLEALTSEPARMGFHGVFRGPFTLSYQNQTWALHDALTTVAETSRAFMVRRMGLAVVGGRVSLVPEIRSRALEGLMRTLTSRVEPHAKSIRSEPLADRAHSDKMVKHPIVTVREDGCFHMPLTDRLPVDSACQLAQRIRPMVDDILGSSHTIGDIALLADPGRGRKASVRERFPLSGELAGAVASFTCLGPHLIEPINGVGRTAEPV